MRGSNIKLLALGLAITAIALALGGVVINHTLQEPGDLRYRYNESLCAHSGVNPFKIWNHEATSAEFKGMGRPDKEFDADGAKLVVHAYPPWHVVYTWFYGWLPFPFVVGIMYFISGLALAGLFASLKGCEVGNGDAHDSWLYWAWMGVWLLPPTISCLTWGQYGIISAGLLAVLILGVKRDAQVLAGVAWGLMMIKPQMATLFFFPLLFAKKYKAIMVALAMSAVATIVLACHYGESPIALILQVPQIGAPYETSAIYAHLPPAIARVVKAGWLVVCIGLCGWLSWRVKDETNYICRFAPAALIFPYWMYSQWHDQIVTWPLVVVMAGFIWRYLNSENRYARMGITIYVGLTILVGLFAALWNIFVGMEIFNPAGRGWIYQMFSLPMSALHFALGCIALLPAKKIRYISQ